MVAVVPGHEKHARLSLSGWNERRSQEVQGANPVGENDPGEHGTPHCVEFLDPSAGVVSLTLHFKHCRCPTIS